MRHLHTNDTTRKPLCGLLAGCAVLAAAVGLLPGIAKAEFIRTQGTLEWYLLNICRPIAGSEAFQEPGQFDLARWRLAVIALLLEDVELATELADEQMYDLVEFTNHGLCLLRPLGTGVSGNRL
jgi:hypothetical protein